MSQVQTIPRKRGRPSKLSLMTSSVASGVTRGISARGRGRPRLRGNGRGNSQGRGRGRGGRGKVQGSMSVSIPIVRIDDNVEPTINIGSQSSRWQNFIWTRGLKNSEETARYLMNSWEASKIQKEGSISLGKATFHDFEKFRKRVNKSSDEIIRFYLRLELEPGQTAIAVSDDVSKVFDTFKTKFNMSSTDLIKYLFDVFEKYSKSRDHSANFDLEMGVRRAVREEMIALVREGVIPVMSNQTSANNQSPIESRDVTSGMANQSLTFQAYDLSPESAKKRSRKSHPQRVVRENQPLDAGLIGIPSVSLQSTDNAAVRDIDVMQYNYVIGVNGSNPQVKTASTTTDMNQGTSSNHTSPATFKRERQVIAKVQKANKELKGTMSYCPHCDYKSTNVTRLKRHKTLHTGKEFHCSMCERSYTEESKLKEHFEVKHEKSVHFKCEICGNKEFTSKGGLKYHFKTMHQKDFPHWCEQCCKGFNQITFYQSHMKKHNGTGKFKCNFCSKEFSYAATLSMHRKTCAAASKNTDVDSLTCPLCGESYTCKPDMNEHMSTEHCDVTRFRCGCGLEFWWRSAFESHKTQCKDAFTPLQNCELIPIAASDQASGELKNENGLKEENDSWFNSIQITNIESGEQFVYDLTGDDDDALKPSLGKVHSCKLCNYTTDKSSHLKRHVLTHKRGRKPKDAAKSALKPDAQWAWKCKKKQRYKCDRCSRTFASKGGITYHQQTKHNNTYKYKCETCDKGFNTIQHYHGHKNTHIGVRPHVCEDCNIGFAYPSVLTSHKKVCKGRGPGRDMNGQLDLYPCKHCSEKFAMLQALKDHCFEVHGTAVEEGGNKYLCECGMEFELRGLYDFHKTTCKLSNKDYEIILENDEYVDNTIESRNKDVDGVEKLKANKSTDNDCAIIPETSKETELDGACKVNEGNNTKRDNDGTEEFRQLSVEKFNTLLVNQPVFPT